MIKAIAVIDNRQTLILGLSREDIDLLQQVEAEAIPVDVQAMVAMLKDRDPIQDVHILAGETDEDMTALLRQFLPIPLEATEGQAWVNPKERPGSAVSGQPKATHPFWGAVMSWAIRQPKRFYLLGWVLVWGLCLAAGWSAAWWERAMLIVLVLFSLWWGSATTLLQYLEQRIEQSTEAGDHPELVRHWWAFWIQYGK